MPGLCGVVTREPDDRIGNHLSRMVAVQKDLPRHRVERFVAPNHDLAIGRVHLGILPSVQGQTRFLHGEESDGFIEVVHDPVRRRVTIRNDAFGMMPVFYCQIGGKLVFATDVKAVLAHPNVETRLDERGLADLLAFGFLLGEKTLVRGVRFLPGGSRLTFDARTGELNLEGLGGFRQLIGKAHARRSEVLPLVLSTFRQAVESRCAGGAQIGVSLSGGLDSRTIIAAIDHRQHRIRTLTVDVAGGADRAIAERIVRHTNGLENHRVVENGDDFFARWPDYAREMVRLTDGMYYDEACIMMPTLDFYREAGIDVVLRGHGGELARMSEAYELRVNRHVRACRDQAALKRQLFRQMNFAVREEELPRLLVPEVAASTRGAAQASFEEAFSSIDPHWHVVDQVSCLYAEQYLPRQCSPSLAQLRSRVEVRLPFLDRQYLAALMEIRPEDRIDSRNHRYLLRYTNPALLWVTNANTGTWAGAPGLVQQTSRKVLQLVKRLTGYERYAHYVDPAAWLRGPLAQPVADILLPRAVAHGFFEPSGVRQALEVHRGGRADCSATLLLLLYIELWRRLFLEGEAWDSAREGSPEFTDAGA